MGREVRRVPPNWQHPKRDGGRYVPLYGRSFAVDLENWDKANAKWEEGLVEDYANDGWKPKDAEYADMTYDEWAGSRPEESDYMPDWPDSERTHYQMYEDTSEGTPISPVMETPEQLAKWLVDNNASAFAGQTASYEGWLRVCNGGFAPSAIMTNGVMQSGVDGLS